MSDDGLLESLSTGGLVGLCCLGLGGVAGGAAVIGGGTSATVVTTGASSARGALISGLVTFTAVLVVVAAVRWRLNR